MNTKSKRVKRHNRIRKNIEGSAVKPRISVYRSNKFVQVQAIDDVNHKTILGMSSKTIKEGTKVESSKKLGADFAKALLKLGKFENFVFDRGGYRFHGRVKALAESLRENGLKF